VILECESDLVSSSSKRDNIVIATVSGQRVRYSSYHRASLSLDGFRGLHWTSFTPSNSPYLMNAHLVRQCYWLSRT
jgi:hypothetical protein